MRIAGREIDVFAITPRTLDPARYFREIDLATAQADRFGFTGVLLFTGNDVYVEPWLAAHHVLRASPRLSPLVAVNPVYMHPFTVAKMISSFAYLHGRRTFLNLVAGTALSHLRALGDSLDHAQRYERLEELLICVTALCRPGLATFRGEHFTLDRAQLFPTVPEALRPTFLISGQSEAAQAVCARTGATHVAMLPPTLAEGLPPASRGVHFGVVTRPTHEAAWSAARERFPPTAEGEASLDASMENTDSSWKRALLEAARTGIGQGEGYWLGPFRSFQADCPYVVGDHAQVARLARSLVERGTTTLVLDVPADPAEFEQVATALAAA